MGTEIERKFLVNGDEWRRVDGVPIRQGYLARERGHSVRVRVAGEHTIEKTRRVVDVDGTKWEVDEFAGENAGLVVAEVELDSEDQAFHKPSWIGQEVTNDSRYLNSELVMRPFRVWDRS